MGLGPVKCPVCSGSGLVPSRRQPTHNLHIPRQQLRSELLAQLPSDVVRWGYRFVRYEEMEACEGGGEGRVRLFVENDAKEQVVRDFAMLVAADGIYSAVSQQLFTYAKACPHSHAAHASPPRAAASCADEEAAEAQESALERYERRAAQLGLRPLGVIVVLALQSWTMSCCTGGSSRPSVRV
jgi:2-polyprenyl-6-methoxyphenol hydroxylase-like FAD-dependent oxidoreductase